MNKTKLAICMKDLEYQSRFVSCFMNHFNHQYELHVFTAMEQLEKTVPLEYAVIITGEYSTDEMANYVERGEILLFLTEGVSRPKAIEENVIHTEKYQEVYKIAEIIERLVADRHPAKGNTLSNAGYRCIGVYSLTQGIYQAPFVALAGRICGRQEKVLVLDLQEYSGLNGAEEGMDSMGLEDLLSAVTSGNYSRGRMLECIRHGENWDYVCSSQNVQSLAEGTQELYERLMGILAEEFGYQKIIINFGTIFMGCQDLMELCQKVYLLVGKDTTGCWREQAFFRELTRKGKEVLLQRTKKVEIPQVSLQENIWDTLVESWTWNYVGELLRQDLSKERPNGTIM